MPIREMKECWNCGHSYDPDESEYCPECDKYPDEEPDYDYDYEEVEE